MHYLIVMNGMSYMATGRNAAAAFAELTTELGGDQGILPTEIIEVPSQHLGIAYDDVDFYHSCLIEFDLIH